MATPPDFTTGQVLTAAQMNQIGLWKITPTSVSGTGASIASNGDVVVATGGNTLTITGCFNTDFVNYKIIFSEVTYSNISGMQIQLRNSGGTAATNYYWSALDFGVNYTGAGLTAVSNAAATTMPTNVIGGNTTKCGGEITIYQPFLAQTTGFTGIGFDARTTGAGRMGPSGFHNAATSYDSIVVTPTLAVNFTTMRVSIYGFN